MAGRIDDAIKKYRLDALISYASVAASKRDLLYEDRVDTPDALLLPSMAGYPALTVPMGEVMGLPVGLLFFGRSGQDEQLLRYAYAYEQGTHHLQATYLPSER